MTVEDLLEKDDLLLDGFDHAVVGVALTVDENGQVARRVIYDGNDIMDELINKRGMRCEEATDYFLFNIGCAYFGKCRPLIIQEQILM